MNKTYIELAEEFLESKNYIGKFVTHKEKSWVYRDNHYEVLDVVELENEIVNLAKATKFTSNTTRGAIANISRNIQALTWQRQLEIGKYLDRQKLDYVQSIPLENGILTLEYKDNKIRYELSPNTPLFFTPYVLPFKYDPNATCETFLRFINSILTTDEIKFIRQWFGYCLVPVTSAEKFLILYGPGSNGKSVLLLILILLIGEENVSHVLLQGFESESDFTISDTVGKLCNIVQEIDRIDKFSTGFLKEYVSGEMVRANEKFRPAYNFRPTARLIFATNFIPITKDDSEGLLRRVIILPFNKTFKGKEKDKRLKNKDFWIRSGELAGIFNWALGGLQELIAQEWDFDEPKSTVEAKNSFKALINPIGQFLEDNVVESKGSFIPVRQLYQMYRSYCNDNGFFKEHSNIFSGYVRRTFPLAEYTENMRVLSTGGKDRLWLNLKLIDHNSPEQLKQEKLTPQTTQTFGEQVVIAEKFDLLDIIDFSEMREDLLDDEFLDKEDESFNYEILDKINFPLKLDEVIQNEYKTSL